MNPKYPVLAILPVASLIIHEHHDQSRTYPLIERIRESRVFTNPVIVTPLHDHTARYMVLDGANRTTSFQKLGYAHILAQVVEPEELGAETETWNHVVWDIDPDIFLERLLQLSPLTFRASNAQQAYDSVIHRQGLAAVHMPDGRVFEVHTPACGMVERNEFLNAIVNTYKDRGGMDRTNQRTVETLKSLYPTLSGLVFMPLLKVQHIVQLVGQGRRLPAGVTRFSISPRALRVNFPLDRLLANESLEVKNETLHQFIQERIARKGVRYYAETTLLYDE